MVISPVYYTSCQSRYSIMVPAPKNPHCTDKSNRGSEKGADLLMITKKENGKAEPRTPASRSQPPDLPTESHRALGTQVLSATSQDWGCWVLLPTPTRGHFPCVLKSGLT